MRFLVAIALMTIAPVHAGEVQKSTWTVGGTAREYTAEGSATVARNEGATLTLVPDSSMIVLTTSAEADRTGRVYGEKVHPEGPGGGENRAAAEGDSTVAAASRWLRAENRRSAR